MTTREALLAAISASPEDDTPRLVFADFLDETGHPTDAARAKLIRTQIAAGRLPQGAGERAELYKLANALWDKYKSTWFPGISSAKLPHPERGFISSWGCYSAAEITEPDVPFTSEPITELTLSTSRAVELAGAEEWHGLARVRELRLWPGTTDDDGMARMLSSPHLTGLHKLWVMGNYARPWSPMPDALRALTVRPQYGTLRDLQIEHADVGNAGAAVLAGATTLTGLTALALGQCDIGVEGWRALLASPVVGRVKGLALGGSADTPEEGEQLAAALAGSAHLGMLEHLCLDATAFTDRAAGLLSRARFPALKSLTILPHPVNHSDQVTGFATMTAHGIDNLLRAPWAAHLETLDLSGQTFGDAGAEALARDRRLGRLRLLTVMGAGFTSAGLRAIANSYAHQLERFQLARNPIGDDGAAAIAEAAWPAMVPLPPGSEYEQRGLFVARCELTETGAKALARSTTIPRDIPDLFIGDAPVSAAVVARLKARYPRATVRFGDN